MPRTLLTDELWSKLLVILLELGLYDKPNLRKTIEGILYRMRTDCPWRDLPAAFGKFQAVYNCFNRWSKKGIFQGWCPKMYADKRRANKKQRRHGIFEVWKLKIPFAVPVAVGRI